MPAYDVRFQGETFKMLEGNKGHTIYRDNRPLARSQKTPWFDANPANFTTTTGGPRAVTVVGWDVQATSGSAIYGQLRVTWYVTFRGQLV